MYGVVVCLLARCCYVLMLCVLFCVVFVAFRSWYLCVFVSLWIATLFVVTRVVCVRLCSS